MDIFREFFVFIGWGITGAITMGFALAIVLWVFTKLTPNLDEMEELKKGNVAVGILLGALLIATSIVLASLLIPVLTDLVK